MGYSLKKLKEELSSRNLANYDLVAWGQKSSTVGMLFGAIGGAIAGATSSKFAISMVENSKIAIFPFTNKEIKYSEAKAFDRTQIENAKVSGLLSKKLKITTKTGSKFSFPITQGAGSVKEILTRLGL